MNGVKVELLKMLEARDARHELQQSLLTEYKKPLISFTMNIAGPIKNNSLIRWAFDYGNDKLKSLLEMHGIELIAGTVIREVTGNEACYVVESNSMKEPDELARKVKKLAMQLEDELEIGRLFDIDILDAEGNHLDREMLGGKTRRCLICGKAAKECGRSRAHSVEELQAKTKEILLGYQQKVYVDYLADMAVKSLLMEVDTTPKPGLVDQKDNGSHKDMTMTTFLNSAIALRPYFRKCVLIGMEAGFPKETFERLRFQGILAEAEMKKETGGINTHKGAIFSLGILLGALGRIGSRTYYESLLLSGTDSENTETNPENIEKKPASDWTDLLRAQVKTMTTGLIDQEKLTWEKENLTAGEKLFLKYGIRGARGEAEDGFPTVFEVGIPMLFACLDLDMSINTAGVQTLMAILADTIDTNMIARSDYETAKAMQEKIRSLRGKDGFWSFEVVEELNQEFIEKNLSPGGSADLLALTYFIFFINFYPY